MLLIFFRFIQNTLQTPPSPILKEAKLFQILKNKSFFEYFFVYSSKYILGTFSPTFF